MFLLIERPSKKPRKVQSLGFSTILHPKEDQPWYLTLPTATVRPVAPETCLDFASWIQAFNRTLHTNRVIRAAIEKDRYRAIFFSNDSIEYTLEVYSLEETGVYRFVCAEDKVYLAPGGVSPETLRAWGIDLCRYLVLGAEDWIQDKY
jgi:hypothetical protein